MGTLDHLLTENKNWAKNIKETDPDFFKKLSEAQNPAYLWIGCSDSRITPVTSFGLLPGEMFVHRNVANLVNHTDINCLSVIQFAVDNLQVKHIIVCGHSGCGGVREALRNSRMGLIDNWLRHIQDIQHKYRTELSSTPEGHAREDKLCELNVIEQVINVGETTIVQDAWARGQAVEVHGWMYTIANGTYQDLGVSVSSPEQIVAMRNNSFKSERA